MVAHNARRSITSHPEPLLLSFVMKRTTSCRTGDQRTTAEPRIRVSAVDARGCLDAPVAKATFCLRSVASDGQVSFMFSYYNGGRQGLRIKLVGKPRVFDGMHGFYTTKHGHSAKHPAKTP